MKSVNGRKEIIEQIISLMIALSWKTRLGNVLIENREINLTTNSLKKLKRELNKSLFTVKTKMGIFVPMGSLSQDSIETDILRNDFYFLLFHSDCVEIILSKLKDRDPLNGIVINENLAKNAIVFWLRDWQMNSKVIKNDLQKIKSKITKEG